LESPDSPAACSECWRLRLAITTALEQLEVGDQRAAVDTLLEAGEPPAALRRFPCPNGCGQLFEWSDLAVAHAFRVCRAWEQAA
jgi:hypothetical protein